MKPTIGRIVHYRLTKTDADNVNRVRAEKPNSGNPVDEGESLAMIITSVWTAENEPVNGQVFLDGVDSLWITSASRGDEKGNWNWPPRV